MEIKDRYFRLDNRFKYKVDLNGTNLEPSKFILKAGFSEKYREQLIDILDSDYNKESDLSRLFTLLLIKEHIDDGELPIFLNIKATARIQREMLNVLEVFFREHERELSILKEYYLSYIEKTQRQL